MRAQQKLRRKKNMKGRRRRKKKKKGVKGQLNRRELQILACPWVSFTKLSLFFYIYGVLHKLLKGISLCINAQPMIIMYNFFFFFMDTILCVDLLAFFLYIEKKLENPMILNRKKSEKKFLFK